MNIEIKQKFCETIEWREKKEMCHFSAFCNRISLIYVKNYFARDDIFKENSKAHDFF